MVEQRPFKAWVLGSSPSGLTTHAANTRAPADLILAARCKDVTPAFRFLSGAVAACGGRVLPRRFSPDGECELYFTFVRAACVAIYCILIDAGLDLTREAHLQLTSFASARENRSRGSAEIQ